MIGNTLLLLIIAKIQDSHGINQAAWKWALGYAIPVSLFGTPGLFPNPSVAALTAFGASAAVLGLYAWGYFALLRCVTDNLPLWLAVYFLGAVLPVLLIGWAVAEAV